MTEERRRLLDALGEDQMRLSSLRGVETDEYGRVYRWRDTEGDRDCKQADVDKRPVIVALPPPSDCPAADGHGNCEDCGSHADPVRGEG